MKKEKITGIVITIIIIIILAYYLLKGNSIKDTIYKAKEDFESENLDNCMAYLSDSFFVKHHYTREELRNRAKDLFSLVDNIEVQIINLEIKQQGDTGWAKAAVKIIATYNQQKIMLLGQPLKAFEGELYFAKENGQWKVIKAVSFPI
jgi:hypothetical protein